MRFDPQANFVPSDGRLGDPRMFGADAGIKAAHPLKAVAVVVVFAAACGAGLWIWSEGIPGRQAAAGTQPQEQLGAAVVQYAEAVINSSTPEDRVAAVVGDDDAGNWKQRDANGPGERAQAEFEAGKKFMAMGRHQDAVAHLSEAVRLDPAFAEARYRLGLAYVHAGDRLSARRQEAALKSLDRDLANLLGQLVGQ